MDNNINNFKAEKVKFEEKKYLEALKKYEEVILLKRDTYGDRSETVSTIFDPSIKNYS